MERLDSPIRTYAWGSRTVLAGLQGRPTPSPEPEAELWMGAHPAAPSLVHRPGGVVSLAELIERDPDTVLGSAVAGRFGPRLPYLLKLLAAAEPLSLQAHPTREQAHEGYEAERAAGAVEFSYVDRHHKPELLVAVSDFEALCGFREPAASADLLDGLAVPELAPVSAALRSAAPVSAAPVSAAPVSAAPRSAAPGSGALRDAVEALLRWPAGDRAGLVDAVVRAASAGTDRPEYALAVNLAKHYPGDVGVVVAMLLNYVTLEPGQAIWMPAGNLHAYLRGTGVEIMAASDNVLRGGLTPKRVDVPELLRVLRFTPLADPVVPAESVAPGVVAWPAPVAEFRLLRVTLDAGVPTAELALPGPRTVFCLGGEVTVDDGTAVTVTPGGSAFGAASDRPLRLTGAGVVFVATTNEINE